MERCGIAPEAVQGIFITHDHSDHVAGLRVFAKKYQIPVYAQPLTRQNLYSGRFLDDEQPCIELNGSVNCADMEITPFETSHDTAQSCGYRICTADGRICAVCTDLGYVPDTVLNMLTGCNLVLLEANYDAEMLRTGPYPLYLKQRIASKVGHLSNDDCGETARRLVETGTARLILGHLSRHNNLPELAEHTVEQKIAGFLRGRDYLMQAAPPETDGRMIGF